MYQAIADLPNDEFTPASAPMRAVWFSGHGLSLLWFTIDNNNNNNNSNNSNITYIIRIIPQNIPKCQNWIKIGDDFFLFF